MAARQDQTLQIFLIICIFLVLVLGVFAYLGWRGYSEADQRAKTLQDSVNTKEATIQTQQTIIEDHQERMGFGRSDDAASVKTAFESDMKKYGPGAAEEGSRFYRNVLETVYNDAQDAAKREAALKEQVSNLNKQMQALEATKATEIAKIDDARKKAEADKAAETNAFNQARERMKKNEADLMAKVDSQKAEFDQKLAGMQADKAALEKEVKKLADANKILKSTRRDEPGSFEFADGRISRVNQNGTVWINLGSDDFLRRQVTFSVFDADQHDAVKATKKGSIEVTSILGPHMAEAKITNDDATNPILTGDQIYSQIWHRGKQLHFALTGFIDFDNDNRSDMQLAQELIQMNGGIVDAYLKEDGTIEGEMTANTRYLILGEIPDSPVLVRLQSGWNSMSSDANKLGVETVTLPEFLGQMGYKPQDRMVQLGRGASARDFPPRPLNEQLPVAQPRFRARTPYRAPAATPVEPEAPATAPSAGTQQ